MLFRDVLPEVERVLAPQSWLTSQHHVTLLRDLHGRVRLMVESPASTKKIDETQNAPPLEAALQNALGSWLGDATPVWVIELPSGKPPKLSALADMIRRDRQPYPLSIQVRFRCFLLDRHAGKRGWVGEVKYQPPWPLAEVDALNKPAILVFFSHKGGVGRSTALAGTAIHLARAGLRVMVVDLDLEAPGLAALFGKNPDVGVVDYLIEQPISGDALLSTLTLPITDPTVIGEGVSVGLVPAGALDAAYLDMLAKLDLQDATAPGGIVDRLSKLFLGLESQSSGLDFLLVDARAGFHDVGGVMLAGLAHGVVVVGLHNPQSWQGVTAVARVLSQPVRTGMATEPVHLIPVLGMGPPPGTVGEEEHRAFREKAHDILTSEEYYPEPQDIPKPGEPYYADLIAWRPELRGRGDALKADTVSVLLSEDYRRLARRIAELYKRGFGSS